MTTLIETTYYDNGLWGLLIAGAAILLISLIVALVIEHPAPMFGGFIGVIVFAIIFGVTTGDIRDDYEFALYQEGYEQVDFLGNHRFLAEVDGELHVYEAIEVPGDAVEIKQLDDD